MQFEVQAVKLPSPIRENNAVINCQVRKEFGASHDTVHNFSSLQSSSGPSESDLITPKKPLNPCLESLTHQHLHRELLFNQRIGKNVLNQKSELRRALEKHKDAQIKKELMQQKQTSKTVLEKAIEERAKKIEMMEKSAETETEKPEFLQVHAKLLSKTTAK